MKYSMTIEYNNSDPKYINDITTWGDVLDTLRHRLDQWDGLSRFTSISGQVITDALGQDVSQWAISISWLAHQLIRY